MARPQVTFLSPVSSQTMSHEQQKYDHLDDYDSTDGCCCFRFKRLGDDGNEDGEQRESWLAKRMKKIKETTEVLAGPKWKTLIRKIGAYFKKKKKQRENNFQYDPESYALNFDREVEEEDCFLPGFSSRFAASSVDQEIIRL